MAAGAPARLPPDDEDEARRADAAWRDWLAEGEAAAARAAVLRRIRAHLAKLERRRGRIAADRAALADADALRRWGELLQIHRHALRPGQSGITVADEFTEGRPPVTIPLDPALDPAGNIAALFQEYRKRRDSAAHVERRGAQTEAEIGRWRGILQRATAGAGPAGAGLAALLASLTPADRAVATPAPAPKEGGAPPAGPMTRVSSDGFTILIGRSKVENDEVTFRIGRGRDWWFHALGIPGAHVLVRNPSGNPLPPATQREAAWLAAYYSKGRPRGAMEVAATQRKHVRKVKGGEPGEVTYAHGHTLWVDLADARGRAILGGEEEGRRDGASGPG
jgi:predicted ribosome quality control (RQC) complex YloA/Tae2 family protein